MTALQPYALQNSSHPASIFRSAVHSAWQGPGVVAPSELAVTAQSTPNMSVQVAGGRAWLAGTQVSNVSGQNFTTQSSYFGLNDAPLSVTIATADATNPRIDLVYAAIQDSFYSGSTNALVIGVVTGTPAASPAAPSAPSNSLTLATVAVAANATSITNSNITATPTASLLAVTRGGLTPCTSSSRPTGLYIGQPAAETDTKRLLYWNGSTWVKWAGPRETVYTNGNAGSSGTVPVNTTTTVLNGTFTVPVAADTGHVEVTVGTALTASTIITWTLTVNGQALTQIQNHNLNGAPLTFGRLVSLPAGSVAWSVAMNASTSGAGLSYSGIRCVI